MSPNEIRLWCELIASLRLVSGELDDWDHIEEDRSWIEDDQPPPATVAQSAQIAIRNYQSFSTEIAHARCLALALKCPDAELVRRARVTLIMIDEALGQADAPAELCLCEDDDEEAIACCKDAMRNAWEIAGYPLKQIVADLSAVAELSEGGKDVVSPDPRLNESEADIVKVLQNSGHRLTTTEILSELAKTGCEPSEGMTKQTLAAMVRHKLLTNDRNANPRGYGLPAWDRGRQS